MKVNEKAITLREIKKKTKKRSHNKLTFISHNSSSGKKWRPEGSGWLQSAQRDGEKKMLSKCSLCGKILLQNWRVNKDIPRWTKPEIFWEQISLTRNTNFSGWKEVIPSSNSNLHEYKRTQEEGIMCMIEKGSIIAYFFSLLLWKCKITYFIK